jgi:O-methyltransferase
MILQVPEEDLELERRRQVRRALRAASYPPRLVSLVEAMLERFAQPGRPDADATMRWLRRAVASDHDDLALARAFRIVEATRIAEDGCLSLADPGWDDTRFVKAYDEARGISAWGRDIRWRAYTLMKAAAGAAHVVGDFVECGVDTGGSARAVMSYLGDQAFESRRFYLFDTFHGLVPEQQNPEEQARSHLGEERYPDVYEIVRANFADKEYVRIVRGVVPSTLAEFEGEQVAFLHIDMNAALPETAALRFFWPKIATGGFVVFDDYGFPGHGTQRKALDAVADELGVEIVMLPTCQGLLVKPTEGGR